MSRKKNKDSGKSKNRNTEDNVIKFVPKQSEIPDVLDQKSGMDLPADSDWEVQDEAEKLLSEALDADSEEEVIRLAREALKVTEDCADAWVLLGHHSEEIEEAVEYYGKGVEAAERVLGEEFIRDNIGNFWELPETRPFMRALFALTTCMENGGLLDAAAENYSTMLLLNPNDIQGARYHLVRLLVELKRDEEAEELFEQYDDEIDASWSYSRALIEFRRHGASKTADKALDDALELNPYVPDYLLGRYDMPEEYPDAFLLGGELEAVAYAFLSIHVWEAEPEALAWLESKA